MSDYIVRATAADSQIRAFAITSKEMYRISVNFVLALDRKSHV